MAWPAEVETYMDTGGVVAKYMLDPGRMWDLWERVFETVDVWIADSELEAIGEAGFWRIELTGREGIELNGRKLPLDLMTGELFWWREVCKTFKTYVNYMGFSRDLVMLISW